MIGMIGKVGVWVGRLRTAKDVTRCTVESVHVQAVRFFLSDLA